MNYSFFEVWLMAGGIIGIFVTSVWILSLVKRDAGIMDIFWGLGFIVVASFSFFLVDGYETRKILIITLTGIWGLRLALHIGIRSAGHPEDPRYLAWRVENGNSWWWRSFFKVFLLQGTVMWIVSLPLLKALYSPEPGYLTLLDWAGISLWTIGFLVESVSDWQLTQFKKHPENKGKLYTSGLWKYTRHPNYFGEAVLWWGFVLIAFSTGGYYTIISPVLMTFLLMKVSGVTMMDKLLKETKSGYEDYIKTTNAFFPGIPKQG